MAIKNFLSGLVGLSLTLTLISCESLKTRSQVSKADKPIVDVTEADPQEVRAEAPEFLQKAPPKLGLILGGGGALAYAHIGLLQELEKQKVSVHSIVGLEWGALVAASYAMTGKPHSVEWSLLKLPISEFDNSSFFSGKQRANIKNFVGFLDSTFKNESFSNLKIPFACPVINISKESSGLRSSGRLKNAIRSCWVSPPHFPLDVVAGHPAGVSEAARFLRQQGAELIVFVDVLGPNKILSPKQKESDAAGAWYWLAQSSLGATLKPPLVDEVLAIPISGHNISSYSSLRSIVRKGQLKAKSPVKGLAKKYAY